MSATTARVIATFLVATASTGLARPIESVRNKRAALSPELSEVNSGSMDWVEIYNPTDATIDLTGFSLKGLEDKTYSFIGDCGSIEANHYMLLVDKDASNEEYQSGDCKLPFGIKTSGHLELIGSDGLVVESIDWYNTAYVAGHSFAKNPATGGWSATSTQTPFAENIITEEIVMPTSVDLSDGLRDRSLAYVQDPDFGAITNVNLRVHSYSSRCTCNQFQHAHNDESCDCTWDDVLADETGRDLAKTSMPCSVSINVDGTPEYWYDNVNAADSSERNPRMDENCVVAVRGGFSRIESIKSFNIKMDKHIVPRTWRGLKRLNMVKLPWELAGGAVTATLMDQFAKMHHFVGMRNTVANLTVTIVDPDSGEIQDVQNMGRYALFENWDEDALDRHGHAARSSEGKRFDQQLYKLNSFDFEWHNMFDDMPAVIDETNEQAMFDFENKLEAKDSENTLKLQEVMQNLNGKTDMSFVDAVYKHFDMRNLATFIAVNVLSGDIDHSGKNSYIYSTEGSDIWYMTPWDYDASWKPIMDMGPQASSIQRYQDHFLFRNILAIEELRNEFIPLYEDKIRELQDGLLNRDTVEDLITKHATVVEPFLSYGKVDRDVLGIKPWDSPSEGAFDPEKMNFELSPHVNIMGQFDFIMQSIEDYVFTEAPPPLFSPVMIAQGAEEGTFTLSTFPVYSTVGHDLKTVLNIYKNRPFDELDGESAEHVYQQRFYEPKWEDVVLAKTVPETTIAEVGFDQRFLVTLNCADVQECSDTQCYVTQHTIDLATDERSPGASIAVQLKLEGTGCF